MITREQQGYGRVRQSSDWWMMDERRQTGTQTATADSRAQHKTTDAADCNYDMAIWEARYQEEGDGRRRQGEGEGQDGAKWRSSCWCFIYFQYNHRLVCGITYMQLYGMPITGILMLDTFRRLLP